MQDLFAVALLIAAVQTPKPAFEKLKEFAGEMINVYHMVADELVATRYCSSAHQPRFKFDTARSTSTELVFTFDGGTNFVPSSYVRSGKLFGEGKLVEDWTFYGGGKETGPATFKLGRK